MERSTADSTRPTGTDRAGWEHLSGDELDRVAENLFWGDAPRESIAARDEAHRRHVAAGDHDRAALSAWHLFYEHWLVGEQVVARSWLERARSTTADPDGAVAAWLAIADADVATVDDRLDDARHHAEAALTMAERTAEPDLTAMALQSLGRAEIRLGAFDRGLALLDRAMIMVIGNRLHPQYTGWVYCNVIATCHGIADLRRASEWSDAALRWCESLRSGQLYPGLCRVYAAELAVLRGDWSDAEAAAERACRELTAYDPRYAGGAHYVRGEIARRRGEYDKAMAAFAEAHRFGNDPQPGLALTHFQVGETSAALRSLETALESEPSAPLDRARLLTAVVEVASAAGDGERLDRAAGAMASLASASSSDVIGALATMVEGAHARLHGRQAAARRCWHDAIGRFVELGMPYEAARTRAMLGVLELEVGDVMTGELELRVAAGEFSRLGAVVEEREAERHLAGRSDADSHGLTDREVEVLRLAAQGMTNRQVASTLVLSPHTVARHLSNIYTKLGVQSRAAATAWAYDHGVVMPP